MAVLSDEQEMLHDMAAAWVKERAPVSAFRRTAADGLGHDPGLWREMVDMGWAGILVPEAHGGTDFGAVGLGLVLEELGRTLVASPLLSTALLAVRALRHGGSAAQQAVWLPRIARGVAIVALAVEEGGRHDPEGLNLEAVRTADGWRLSGRKSPVLEGAAADLFIVAARQPDGEIGLLLVERETKGVSIRPLDRLDGRDAAVVRFDAVAVPKEAALAGGAALLDDVLDGARAGLAAEMLGTATQAFEITLEYLRTRVQFGQPIGAFQALQHRAVAMQGELVMTRSAVEAALRAVEACSADRADRAKLVSLAKALAGDTLRLVAREMVQMHGGIGMTEEHDAGLYYKRALVADTTWGDAAFHRERYALLAGY